MRIAGRADRPARRPGHHISGAIARRDDVRLRRDEVLCLPKDSYPEGLRGLRPAIYAGSNIEPENLRGLINLGAALRS